MTDTLPDDDDLLAAEYVLGLADAAARAIAEARVKRDPQFAAAVAAWENRLGGLNDGYDDAPAPNLLPQIEARLFPVARLPKRGWFRLAAGAAVAAALAVAVVVTQAPTPPAVLATLTGAGLTYEVRSDGERLQITRVAGTAAPAGQVHELWIIAPGAAPVALGLLGDAPLDVTYPTPPAGWTMAVSVEPSGGSTTGTPTGPVILTAEIGL